MSDQDQTNTGTPPDQGVHEVSQEQGVEAPAEAAAEEQAAAPEAAAPEEQQQPAAAEEADPLQALLNESVELIRSKRVEIRQRAKQRDDLILEVGRLQNELAALEGMRAAHGLAAVE